MAGVNYKSWAVWGPIIITLISGTVSSLGNKIAFDTPVEGTCGKNKFGKAYFFTLAMFIGEAMCLGLYYAKQWRARRQITDSYSSLDASDARLSPVQSGLNQPFNVSSGQSPAPLEPALAAPKPKIWVYAVLSCFDLSATAISGVGLLWVDASTNQMLRGSMVVFCAIFSVILLKRRLSRGQWGSIGVVVLGLVMVGLKQQLEQKYETPDCPASDSSKPSSGKVLLGIMLVLAGSALNAVQNVLEEKLMKGAEVDPLELVGWEGVFGLILSSFLLMPVVQHLPGDDCGHTEDTLNTLKQLGNSPLVLCMVLSYIFGLMFMNWTSQQITQQLSSVHRNLVSAVRTVLVWMCMLILYYSTSHSCDKLQADYGEKWTVWSVLELGGFAVLVGGTILYSYCGILLARQQENEENMQGQFRSPDYVLPIEPTLAEHQHIVKQQSFSNKVHGAGYQAHL